MQYSKHLWLITLICAFACINTASHFFLYAAILPHFFIDLPKEDRALLRDLILLNYPPSNDQRDNQQKLNLDPVLDVAIIGAGMAGLTAGAALFKEGISHIKLFDQNAEGSEGPWTTYARMKTLRTAKDIVGPALGIPHLTFHAWFEAVFGAEDWKKLGKIPNGLWMDYLKWYRHAMQLPVENHCTLVSLIPFEDYFELEFLQFGQPLLVKARKVVLATGRAGFGGPVIPDFVQDLPKTAYAHTTEYIDFEALKNRRIGIIGVGASSFDAAAAALETGVKSVDLIMRRERLPNVNKFTSLPFKGFSHSYCQLSDEKRWQFMCAAFDAAIPPPVEALKRVEGNPNLRILSNLSISQISYDGTQINVESNRGLNSYDFLILGTGFHIDGYQQPELQHVIENIALWKDYLSAEIIKTHPKMGNFPYLGPSFEFLPKKPGTAPYLKNLYCYNYGATLSHGLLSSDIPAISIGATRLAQGIATDFFVQESDKFLQCLKEFDEKDFEQEYYLLNIQ